METGSTIGAAARMEVSQSAVSRLLGQLEESLGVALFLRRNGRLTATPEADELLADISGLLDGMQRVQRRADDLRLGRSSKTLLKLGVPPSMSQQLIPRLVAAYLRDRQNVVVELLIGANAYLERAVLERSADLALVRLPVENDGLDVTPVLEAEGVCVMPLGHPLALKEVVDITDLRGVPMVMLGRQRALRAELDLLLRGARVAPQVHVEVHSVAAACAFVAEGTGVAIVNAFLVSHFSDLPIVTRRFEPSLPHAFGLISRTGQPHSRALEHFAQHLREQLLQASLAFEQAFENTGNRQQIE
ncbi:DNA-binding transcriptional regulator, LysR family [Pseudomonas sp. URIL14HWK12:I9]|nr:DNA-binding transcriptional LysR family regulator [Pseudomonas sp. URIL14HWK12:I12]PVZ25615.1 DNA-binding transcriptional LysR family regulator [Pseudomonas sp. URIL14HWK12:I10]PVZ36861.1 DNA-binding transcriptional LysR family regulator [Pseudomonas sp. URIL14HWK12:I11]SNZ12465.1 DNA-binding transcriptional regulator, LysR family [Pseudomonas sp. URIL14HWK12:I9]